MFPPVSIVNNRPGEVLDNRALTNFQVEPKVIGRDILYKHIDGLSVWQLDGGGFVNHFAALLESENSDLMKRVKWAGLAFNHQQTNALPNDPNSYTYTDASNRGQLTALITGDEKVHPGSTVMWIAPDSSMTKEDFKKLLNVAFHSTLPAALLPSRNLRPLAFTLQFAIKDGYPTHQDGTPCQANLKKDPRWRTTKDNATKSKTAIEKFQNSRVHFMREVANRIDAAGSTKEVITETFSRSLKDFSDDSDLIKLEVNYLMDFFDMFRSMAVHQGRAVTGGMPGSRITVIL